MNQESFSFIDDSDFQKIPPHMVKPQPQTPEAPKAPVPPAGQPVPPQGQAIPPQAPTAQAPVQPVPQAPKDPHILTATDAVPPQAPAAPAQQADPTQDPGIPSILMDAAEKVEAEKRARREAAQAAKEAAGKVEAEPVQDVTTLVTDAAMAGGKVVPRFIRTKTKENIYVTKPEFIIGKSKLHADYAIEHNTAVSREHCIITREANGANYITDNKSTNGTYVNGVKLEAGKKQLLTDGTKVKLGDEEFIFRLRSGE